jgi:protoheme IX farnesyltransferase
VNSRAATDDAPRDLSGIALSLVQLSKPSVTRMVLATAACGAVIAPGSVRLGTLAAALVGTGLVVSSANALNMYLEGDVDALMARTRNRPIPSGRLAPEAALWFGLALSAVGIPMLALAVNGLTALLGAVALCAYVLAYTPLKRVSPVALYVGAVPGAMPPLMGFTSMTGELSFGGLSLFLLLFVWQLPHFHAIAVFRRSEYARAGLKVLPVVEGLEYTKFAIVALLILQLFVSALPAFLGLGHTVYIVTATVLGLVYLGWGLWGLRPQSDARWARSLFFASMPYLLAVLAALVVDAT